MANGPLSTHLFVSPKEWDSTRQRVKGTNESAKITNAILKQILNRLYKKEAELLERGYVLTADLLRDAFLEKVDAIQSKILVQTYQEFRIKCKTLWNRDLSTEKAFTLYGVSKNAGDLVQSKFLYC